MPEHNPGTPATGSFAEFVRIEVGSARVKNPENMNSLHEAYAVILEEVDELWKQAKKKFKNRDHRNVFLELVQIGAMAQRAAEDLKYIEQS